MQPRRLERCNLQACAALFAQVFSSVPWNEPWHDAGALARLEHFFESPGAVGGVGLGEGEGLAGFLLGNLKP